MPKIGPFHFVHGSGNAIKETREVRDFDGVRLSGVGAIFITQTGEESLSIEADDNILPLLTSEVHGGLLELGVHHGGSITPRTPIRYYLTVKDLRSLDVSGSGSVQMSALSTDELRVTVSGTCDFQAPALTARSLRITISGSGDISFAGQAAEQEIRISGTGSYHAADLASDRVRASLSGAGNATINARETLDARISGVGSIRYTGQPTITKSVSGVGSIRPLNG